MVLLDQDAVIETEAVVAAAAAGAGAAPDATADAGQPAGGPTKKAEKKADVVDADSLQKVRQFKKAKKAEAKAAQG